MALSIICCLLFILHVVHGVTEVSNDPPAKHLNLVPRLEFYPQKLKGIVEQEHRSVSFGIGWESSNDSVHDISNDDQENDFLVSVVSEMPTILEIFNSTSFPHCMRARDEQKNFSFTVKGVFVGYTKVRVSLKKGCKEPIQDHEDRTTRDFELVVSVVRPPSILVNTVTGIFAALVAFNYVNMGVQLDLGCIGKVLKRPIGPTIGFVCQFLFMPLVSKINFFDEIQ